MRKCWAGKGLEVRALPEAEACCGPEDWFKLMVSEPLYGFSYLARCTGRKKWAASLSSSCDRLKGKSKGPFCLCWFMIVLSQRWSSTKNGTISLVPPVTAGPTTSAPKIIFSKSSYWNSVTRCKFTYTTQQNEGTLHSSLSKGNWHRSLQNYTCTRPIPTAPQTPHKTTAVRAALIRKLMLQQIGIKGSSLEPSCQSTTESSTASKGSSHLSWIAAFCFS